MPWSKKGAYHCNAQLELPLEGHAIKQQIVCNSWDASRALVHAKRSGTTLLSSVSWGINRIKP